MWLCYAHVEDDPDTKCAGGRPSKNHSSGGPVGHDAFRLLACRSRADGRSANAGRDARAPPWALAREAEDPSRPGHSARARVGMIVVDASTVTELLLQTALGTLVEQRLYQKDHDLHAP